MKYIVVVVCLFSYVRSMPDGYHYDSPHGEPLVQKHIYVHVPPPDPEFHAPPQRLIPAPPPKKHYKIVFIKAPTYAPPTTPVIPELQQHQEKTLIYVLHKNPSDAPPIIIPTAKPTQPSKPEVYFIRYKTQKEVKEVNYPHGNEHNDYLPSPSSTAGYVSSTLAPHFVSSTRPYIRSSRTPAPNKYKTIQRDNSQDSSNFVSSTLAPQYVSTSRPYIRASRTPSPKFITPKTPIHPVQKQDETEEIDEDEEEEEKR